ncbi:hypothetical protein [Kribbella sp. CA-293567]|uniref:hypothetical protein n=1 Tax=Kribbella sp. CA-293567 TaxID=3002436 RepID=UPI0022DD0263|nr:hypothetical protein [Kribbella sp. CA-293567]WBQ03343.1 hypothetical protein OX958_25615 [Kribbella sp. CA-293567]
MGTVAGVGVTIALALGTALPADAFSRRVGPFSTIEGCENKLAVVIDSGFMSGGCYEQDGQYYFKYW